jgi:hypothetical protein
VGPVFSVTCSAVGTMNVYKRVGGGSPTSAFLFTTAATFFLLCVQERHCLRCSVLLEISEHSHGPDSFVRGPQFAHPLFSTRPPIHWIPGIKQPGRETDHSPPCSAEG